MNLWRRQAENSDAADAKARASEHLTATQEKWPEVRRVAASLREIRERNHFAERIELLIRGGN